MVIKKSQEKMIEKKEKILTRTKQVPMLVLKKKLGKDEEEEDDEQGKS